MKLKVPELNPVLISQSDERCEGRYIAHCANIALILAHSSTIDYSKARIWEYLHITNAEQEER